MPRIIVGWIVGILAGVLWFGLLGACGQAESQAPAAPQLKAKVGAASETKRTVYFVKHGTANDLANALGKHFQGDIEVQLVPESSNNCLLITAAPGVFADVLKVLEQLDRQPRQVALDLLVVDIAARKTEGPKPGPPANALDAAEFTGPTTEVLAKVETLKKAGRIGYFRRIQLSATEGQQTLINIGEMKPMVTGSNVAAGHVSRNITYRSTGTIVKVTARVTGDVRVLIALSIEDSRLRVPEDGIALGSDEKNQPIPAAETTMAKLDSTLSVRSGQALAAQAVQTVTKAGQEQTFVIVAARIVDK